jgi:hypothetical protein
MLGVIASLALLLAALQDPWRIDAKLQIDDDRILLAGLTDLPDNAVLRVDLFEADTEEGRQLASEAVRVTRGGAFRFEVRPFNAPIPPGRYHARVRFVAALQDRTRVLRAIESSGRPPDAEARYNLQVGTDRERIEAALSHARELAARMDDIVREIDGALADRRRLEDAAAEVERIRRERRRLEPLDRHYLAEGVAAEFFAGAARCAKSAFEALRGAQPDEARARERRDAAAEWAREGRLRLGLNAPLPDSALGTARALRALLSPRERAADVGDRARELLLRLAQLAGRSDYGRVFELTALVEAMLRGEPVRARVEELLGTLGAGPP